MTFAPFGTEIYTTPESKTRCSCGVIWFGATENYAVKHEVAPRKGGGRMKYAPSFVNLFFNACLEIITLLVFHITAPKFFLLIFLRLSFPDIPIQSTRGRYSMRGIDFSGQRSSY